MSSAPRIGWWVTGVFAVVSFGAAAWSGLLVVVLIVDLALFVAGCVGFGWAYFKAVGRSREEAISLAGLFFLAEGVAPKEVAWSLRGALGVQIAVALVTAAIRPFSTLAFGVLAPMFGLGMLAVWGAAFAQFPSRQASE